MAYVFSLADSAFLDSPEGAAGLNYVSTLELSQKTLISDISALGAKYPEWHQALVETVLIRRKVAGKLRFAAQWLLTDDAAQQATSSVVAQYRAQLLARRMPGASVHDVTCGIGAEIAELVTQFSSVSGSDLDEVRVAMAAHNVPAAQLSIADALTVTVDADLMIADPGRRAGGRRTFSFADTQPPLLDLLARHQGRAMMVKCAPGLDYEALRNNYGFTGEVEIISVDGGVKEAALYVGPAADVRATAVVNFNRATVFRDGKLIAQVDSCANDECLTSPVRRYVIEPDGAIIRAGLVKHFGVQHNLSQLDPHLAYLTGEEIPSGARGWEYRQTVPLHEKALRAALADYDCGILEIVVRGVDVDPDQLRKRLKLKGSAALALIIARIGDDRVGLICNP